MKSCRSGARPPGTLLDVQGAFPEPEPTPAARPPRDLHVVVLTGELTGSGPPKSSVDLTTALAREGYRATCVAHPRRPVPSHSVRQLRDAGAQLHLLPPACTRSPLCIVRAILALRRLQPNVVLMHSGAHVSLLAAFKRAFCSPRLIFVKRGFWDSPGVRGLLLRRALPRIDATACISQAVARFWALAHPEADASSLCVAHVGIEVPSLDALPSGQQLRTELAIPPDARVVGTLGRLDWRKGHKYLVAALPIIVERVPQAHLVVAGDGPCLSDLRSLAEALGVSSRTRFVGWREDIRTVLAGMDVFVHPTLLEFCPYRTYAARWRRIPLGPRTAGEPLGRTILEAAAAGVPVVATDAGGHRDVITDEETGLLVPVADAEAIAEAVVRLLENPGEAAAMAQAARKRIASDFCLEALGRRFHYLIQGLIAGSR